MNQRQLRTLPKANLMLLFFAAIPEHSGSYTEKEKALLTKLKKNAYSATGIFCTSFDNARRLISSFIDPSEPLRHQVETCYPVISYPIMMPAQLMHIYARGDFLLGIIREFVHPNMPKRGLIRDDRFYFIFDLQPLGYKELLSKISGPDSK